MSIRRPQDFPAVLVLLCALLVWFGPALLAEDADSTVRPWLAHRGLAFPLDVSGLKAKKIYVGGPNVGEQQPTGADRALFSRGVHHVGVLGFNFWKETAPKARAFVIDTPSIFVEDEGRYFIVAVHAFGTGTPPDHGARVAPSVWEMQNTA